MAACPTDYSFSGPAFVDISSTGTQITSWTQNPDDGYTQLELPFTFPWYGLNEQVIQVGTNGYITFGGSHFGNGASEPIPGTPAGPVDGVIGVYWADINPGASNADGAGVYYQAFGTDSLVVQWNNVVYWTGNRDPTTNTFEATLFSNGGIILAYGAMNDQISYNVVPDSDTAYYIPEIGRASCRERV